jgi:hypothetical protein
MTPEVLGATDVVVTMGHSVGVFDIPDGVRHEDWRVGDPVGAQLDEVRRVREDIGCSGWFGGEVHRGSSMTMRVQQR